MAEFGGAKLILFIGTQIVVLERDNVANIPWPGRLDLPGGGRDGDETAEACIIRETREEVGLDFTIPQLVWRSQLNRGVFFAAHLPAGHEARIRFGTEGVGWQLMMPDDYVRHPKAIPHFADMVARYMSKSAGP